LGFGHLQEVDPREDASIVHQDVDASEGVPRLHHAADVTQTRDTACHSHRTSSCLMNVLRDSLTSRLIVQVIDHHVRALASKGEGDRLADSLLRARHQRHLPG
jgi:hypothetical protein